MEIRGLLTSLVFKQNKNKTNKIGIVAHHVDADLEIVRKLQNDDRFIIINPLDHPNKVIAEITSCKLILASSLHGLIVSDSFKVPNMWIQLSDRLMGIDYKFKDYYSTLGKEVQNADLNKIFDNDYLNDLKDNYRPIKNLKEIQDNLIKAFPFN